MNATSAMLLWGVLLFLFLLTEALTPQLLCIWFAVGALAALVCAALSAPFWLQVFVMLAVSAAALILTRPLVKKFQSLTQQRLNANRIIGRHGIVEQEISPMRAEGQIRIDGALWSAKSETEEPIPVGVRIKVLRIEGVKAVVRVSRVQPDKE